MILTATVGTQDVRFDMTNPIDISIPITESNPVNAFHLPAASFTPFEAGEFIGSVEHGGPVRCDVVEFAPHGNGTHTECVGHISGKQHSLRQTLLQQLFIARLVSIDTSETNGVVTAAALETQLAAINQAQCSLHAALIIRTLPNDPSKQHQQWSGNNPGYIHPEAMKMIVEWGVDHLVVDLPSVDPEEDDGRLECHHLFWNYPQNARAHATITELVYVPNEVDDGVYLIDFNAANFDADAAPSRPTLYQAVD